MNINREPILSDECVVIDSDDSVMKPSVTETNAEKVVVKDEPKVPDDSVTKPDVTETNPEKAVVKDEPKVPERAKDHDRYVHLGANHGC